MAVKRTGRAGAPGGAHVRNARTRAQFGAYAELLQLSEGLQREVAELLKTVDLSAPQYNVLRVLRGAGPRGLTCGEVGGRLVRHDPDVTRLLDRLERRGLIQRARAADDRRVVRTQIADSGLALLADLDGPIDALHEQQFGHLGERQLADLTRLLQEARRRGP